VVAVLQDIPAQVVGREQQAVLVLLVMSEAVVLAVRAVQQVLMVGQALRVLQVLRVLRVVQVQQGLSGRMYRVTLMLRG